MWMRRSRGTDEAKSLCKKANLTSIREGAPIQEAKSRGFEESVSGRSEGP